MFTSVYKGRKSVCVAVFNLQKHKNPVRFDIVMQITVSNYVTQIWHTQCMYMEAFQLMIPMHLFNVIMTFDCNENVICKNKC